MSPRPWRLPLFLCVISAAVLVFLLAWESCTRVGARTDRIVTLERRDALLRGMVDGHACAESGSLKLGTRALTPEEKAVVPPPAPSETSVPPASLPEGKSFDGTLVDLLRQATVLILVSTPSGKLNSGTGFFVAPGTVLTNRHVVESESGRRVVVVSRTLGVKQAEVKFESPPGPMGSPDFAVLRVPDSDRIIPLTFGPPADLLLNVVAAGFPGMVLDTDERFKKVLRGDATDAPDLTVTTGVVGQVQESKGTTVLLHQAQVTPGNSGGPLVDGCGRVMGVNTYILAAQEGRWDYALASADAARFLSANGVAVRSATGICTPTGRASTGGESDGGVSDGGRQNK